MFVACLNTKIVTILDLNASKCNFKRLYYIALTSLRIYGKSYEEVNCGSFAL